MDASSSPSSLLDGEAPEIRDKEQTMATLEHQTAHTDSLVTIRLSYPRMSAGKEPRCEQFEMAIADTEEPARVHFEEHSSCQKDVEAAAPEAGSPILCEYLEEAIQSERGSSVSSRRETLVEFPNIELENEMLHIRTNSVASYASSESVHVDWEELDKNEEQKQRDEGSDEV